MATRTAVMHGELELFKEYLIGKGFELQEPISKYEVLRARYKGKKKSQKWANCKHPLILFDRDNRGCGYTLQNYYESLEMSFYIWKQKRSNNGK